MENKYKLLQDVSETIFRAYDIRGIVDEQLTEDAVYTIGKAVGSLAQANGQQKMVIARDGRLSGPTLIQALRAGIQSSGCDVIDIGAVPTPVLYYATNILETQSGVMLTGSHNPANYNGIKIVIDGETLSEKRIQEVYQHIISNDFCQGEGQYSQHDIVDAYIERICSDVKLARPLDIVVDCGNGIAGDIAPKLYRALGCHVTELFCDVDGNFPNHHPDPSVAENMQDLMRAVLDENADVGLAFDGDADRLGVVSDDGQLVWPDRQMMLFAQSILQQQANAEIIFDVKCSQHLQEVIEQHGGVATMWKTGHSLIKSKLHDTKAALAGEMSGHIFFNDRWYGFDDGMYAGARLLEIISQSDEKVSDSFSKFPISISTPELKIAIDESEKFSFMRALQDNAEFPDASIITLDGLRVEYSEGWGLIRPSNTSPYLVMRFEADSEAAMLDIQNRFKKQILLVKADLVLPF